MNLWAKHIGQLLAVLTVVLFFLSCQDEASLLGYKNPNTKFQVKYVEIPLESSVVLFDSLRTSNFSFEDETSRLLIGQYVDGELGTVSTTAYTQYFTTTADKLAATSTYDSASLQLNFDFYYYGSKDRSTSQNITVYEVVEEMSKGLNNYFNNSEVQINSTPIGSKSFTVDVAKIDENLKILQDDNTGNDTLVSPITLKIPLNNLFGQKLFANAMAYANGTDTTFVNDILFTKIFQGLALKSTGDKIVGFNPTSATSSIALHYHTADANNLKLNLGFTFSFRTEAISGVKRVTQRVLTGFTQIKSDRAGSPLAGLTQYFQDFNPSTDLRYIQSGTGVNTKLDLGNFFTFADTVPNLVINSAELIIGSVEESANYPISTSLVLRILDKNNRFEKFDISTNKQDSIDIAFYNPTQYASHRGSITVDDGSVGDDDNAFFVLGDQSPFLAYSSTKKSFNGNYSLFFQQLSIIKESKRRFQYLLLYPSFPARPSSSKTVNRTVFPKSDIKLKIYYTKPTVPLN